LGFTGGTKLTGRFLEPSYSFICSQRAVTNLAVLDLEHAHNGSVPWNSPRNPSVPFRSVPGNILARMTHISSEYKNNVDGPEGR
jgi:hypothetical protein